MGRTCGTYGGGAYRALVGKSEEGDHFEDPGIGEMIKLK